MDYGSDKKKMLGNLIGGFIVILVGVTLIPVIADEIARAGTNDGTIDVTNMSVTSPTAFTILNLTTLFFALGIMSAGVSLAVGGLRNAGLV